MANFMLNHWATSIANQIYQVLFMREWIAAISLGEMTEMTENESFAVEKGIENGHKEEIVFRQSLLKNCRELSAGNKVS